jgi:hypothetical protein
MKTSSISQFMRISTLSLMLLTVGMQSAPAHALPAKPPPVNEKALDCLGDLTGTLYATPKYIEFPKAGTLRWSVTVPSSCTGIGVKLYVDNQVVSPTGSRSIQPVANTGYKLRATLPAVHGGGSRTLATTTVEVTMPQVVTINANYMVPLLVQALSDPFKLGTYSRQIYIENHVELDLSGLESIPIREGVTLAGGRTSREPGPRLFTTIRPNVLFEIAGDNVRISGLRIEGPDHSRIVPEDEEPNKGIGIRNINHVNVEISNNEIYGWSQAAVRVDDCDGKEGCPSGGWMLPSENPTEVRIHDNYIHHNQRAGREGYGVSINDGAYASIKRNVFDWNRHAIKGGDELVANDPLSGAGYAAYSNLVLQNGGYHDTYNACDLDLPDWAESLVKLPPLAPISVPILGIVKLFCLLPTSDIAYTHYTHQFDMHGTETCFPGHLNCGDGGHSMYIRHNTFLYTAGDAIKLRGTPQLGMFVESNVFAHDILRRDDFDVLDGLSATGCTLGGLAACADVRDDVDFLIATAVEQTQTGLFTSDNLVGVNGMNELGTCDFDGDGLNDTFMATGATWWFSSGGDRPWVFLNTSTKRRAEVTLGQFDGDNRCDVLADGIIYPGGKPEKPIVNGGALERVVTGTAPIGNGGALERVVTGTAPSR